MIPMKLPGYYSSGEFARMANVSIRTIRFYDKQNILKPSYVNPSGARFYTDSDLARLQQILLLKYLGFSLDDIKEMTLGDTDYHYLLHSLKLQQKLVVDRMEQLQLVGHALEDTVSALETHGKIDWSQMLDLIHLTNIEKSLKSQYQNATNISARISLHTQFSKNKQGWFPWIYEQCQLMPGMQVLELGCGDGALWTSNQEKLPQKINILLSDISEGMLRDARRNIGQDSRFTFQDIDCRQIPCAPESFDLVIANHVLFYCQDLDQVFTQITRVLKPGGRFLCSTYGPSHMKEISSLVQEFDSRITLSMERLYEHFGLQCGEALLSPYFASVECRRYEDSIELNTPEPLISYILSCHGNQNQLLLNRYAEFHAFVEKKTRKGFHISKDAGIFVCCKD